MAERPAEAWRMGEAARRRVERFPWSDYGRRVALVHSLVAAGKLGEEIQKVVGNQ